MALKNVTKGKIATVVNSTQIAINAGSLAGVRKDDVVTLNNQVKVIDPDTKESLGTVLVAKLRLKVLFAAEKYSVAQVVTRAGSPNDPWSAKVLGGTKEVTVDIDEEDENTILVQIGEEVTIRREDVLPEQDEPPF